MEDKRLIEVDFPLKEVSEESVREKNIHQGHISTLHIWWARRPLAASRATIFAALVAAPKDRDDLERKLAFIAELSKFQNSANARIIENARKEISDFSKSKMPKVLDCFAGGGAIPLEALRLGCETYASELNPVAVLLLKAVLEYPQIFGNKRNGIGIHPLENALLRDIKKWSCWVLAEAQKELKEFYPPDPDGSIPLNYLWVRTVKCRNPSCGAEIPLMREFWLSKKANNKTALKMVADKKNRKIDFRVVQGKEIDFDPSGGTTRQATAFCPICQSGVDGETIRRETRDGKTGQRLIVVVLHRSPSGKSYRIAKDRDLNAFRASEHYLRTKVKNWKYDLNPIPDEYLPTPDRGTYVEGGLFYNFASVVLYGMKRWGDLFNERQKLTLITFVEKVRLAYSEMLKEKYEPDYAKAVLTYLAIGIDRLANRNSILNIWNVFAEKTEQIFLRQAFPMVWDYAEINPVDAHAQGWTKQFHYVLSPLESLISVSADCAKVVQATATRLPFPDNFFDAVATDPPYYDNVHYADLSDFFYVWLKRTLGDLYPDLFSTPLTPKAQEIIDDLPALRGMKKCDVAKFKKIEVKDRKFFENNIGCSFKEIHRVLKPRGIAIIVFAHKSTDAWETIINSLVKSGLILTASWPIHTEKKARPNALESAALASSVYMVCRKLTQERIAYFNEIKKEIEGRIREKLTQFWEQGISGADFFVSAIGPAVEVFGKYSKVEKLSGEEVSVQELLEYVRKIVSEFALERVLKRADLGGVDAQTRFYLLWRWTFGNAKVPFDEAIKLSRPMGVEITQLWDSGGFVRKEKGFVIVSDPKERARDPAFLRKAKFTSMIDVLHHAAILWESGEREKIKEVLNETGYAGNEVFWQTAQAISEVLPKGDKEKQLLQGLLYSKEIYAKGTKGETSLTEYMERR
jgi:adenine-specific DNA methylase